MERRKYILIGIAVFVVLGGAIAAFSTQEDLLGRVSSKSTVNLKPPSKSKQVITTKRSRSNKKSMVSSSESRKRQTSASKKSSSNTSRKRVVTQRDTSNTRKRSVSAKQENSSSSSVRKRGTTTRDNSSTVRKRGVAQESSSGTSVRKRGVSTKRGNDSSIRSRAVARRSDSGTSVRKRGTAKRSDNRRQVSAVRNDNVSPFQLNSVQAGQLNAGLESIVHGSNRIDSVAGLEEGLVGVVIDHRGEVVDGLFIPAVLQGGANFNPLNGTGLTPDDLFDMGTVEWGFGNDFYLSEENEVVGGASDRQGGYWWNVDNDGDGSIDASVHTQGDPNDGPTTGDTITYDETSGDIDSGSMYTHNEGAWIPYDDNDIDNDGVINGRDPDMDGDGVPNDQDPDIDGDGAVNEHDDLPENPHQGQGLNENGNGYANLGHDTDEDGIPDFEDEDMDGDGIANHEDDDVDGDEIPNEHDDDDDGDGTPDNEDDSARGAICAWCTFDEDTRTSFNDISGAPVNRVFEIHMFNDISDIVDISERISTPGSPR